MPLNVFYITIKIHVIIFGVACLCFNSHLILISKCTIRLMRIRFNNTKRGKSDSIIVIRLRVYRVIQQVILQWYYVYLQTEQFPSHLYNKTVAQSAALCKEAWHII